MQAPTKRSPIRCGMRGISLAVIAVTFVSSAVAQVERQVTEADIQRAKKMEPKISAKDIERASRANPLLGDAEIRRAEGLSTPNVDAIPLPKGGSPVDLGAIAKGYEQLGQAGSNASNLRADKKALLVFVSFSMPEKALMRLVEQAARTDATLVLRGLEGHATDRCPHQKAAREEQGLIPDRPTGLRQVRDNCGPYLRSREGRSLASSVRFRHLCSSSELRLCLW